MAEIHSPLEVLADLSAGSANMTSEQCHGGSDLGVNVGGLIAIIVFYVAVLLVSFFHYETYTGWFKETVNHKCVQAGHK